MILTLSDKTGNFRVIDYHYTKKGNNLKIKIGDVVQIKGNIERYQDKYQIILSKDQQLKVVEKGEYDSKIFIYGSKISEENLVKEVKELISTVKKESYKRLLEIVFNGEFLKKFIKSPAAINVHHAYIGGLAEHTIEVAKLCDKACQVYKVDRDLTVTGALLHDIGKVEEFLINDGVEKTDHGEFLGHIFIGANMVKEKAHEMNLNDLETNKIVHIILSHHGEIEWGSPVTPRTKEAQIVATMDNLSAKIQQFDNVIQRDLESGNNWSEYDRRLERRIWLK